MNRGWFVNSLKGKFVCKMKNKSQEAREKSFEMLWVDAKRLSLQFPKWWRRVPGFRVELILRLPWTVRGLRIKNENLDSQKQQYLQKYLHFKIDPIRKVARRSFMTRTSHGLFSSVSDETASFCSLRLFGLRPLIKQVTKSGLCFSETFSKSKVYSYSFQFEQNFENFWTQLNEL